MSQDHAEVVRALYERYREGDFGASAPLLDPHVVMVLGPDFPDSGSYLGAEAVAEYTKGLLEPWTDFTMEAKEIVPAGDSVLVEVRQRGVGSGSGVATELNYFTLWSFRGDKAIRIDSFRHRGEALEAAGLSE